MARRKYSVGQIAAVENTGVLLASGMIAGEALMGLVVAIFAMFNIFFADMLPFANPNYAVGVVIMLVIGYFFVRIPLKKADSMKK